MPLLPHNQQRQSTEGVNSKVLKKTRNAETMYTVKIPITNSYAFAQKLDNEHNLKLQSIQYNYFL